MELTERDVQYTEEGTEEERFSEVIEGETNTNGEMEDSISIKGNEQLQDCLVYGGEYSFDLDGDETKESLCLRYDGSGAVQDTFLLTQEFWETPDMPDGPDTVYTYRDEIITREEFMALREKILQ